MTYERIEKCPLCNSAHFSNNIICEDHSVSHESFALTKCQDCNFIFTNPRPDETLMGQYYDSKEYVSHTNKADSFINYIYKVARVFTLRWKHSIISKYSTKGNILDYGCGTGEFLQYCSKKDWNCFGVEPNQKAKSILDTKTNITSATTIEDIKDEKFDVITLWHVLEHIHNIDDTINSLIKSLKPKGKLIIAVPNIECVDATNYGEYWAAYDVPRHLSHFTQDTFKQIAKKHKLKIKETIPMKLDAFYINMLSEKYKSGKVRYIKSLLSGFKSNSYARNNNNNYASLIYILSK